MSTILKSFDWRQVSRNNEAARSRNYPWTDWLDGRIWQLEPDVDFDGPAVSLERVIRTSANRRGLKVRVRIIEGDNVVVQRHDKTDVERGITKSPSKRSLREASTNGNRPAKRVVTSNAKGHGTVKRIKRLTKVQ